MLDTTTTTNYMPDPTGCGSMLDPTPSGSRRWHVVAAISQQEHRALFELLNQGFNAYLPLHLDAAKQRITPLFGGYLFAAFDPASDPWGRILSTRGVWSLLRNSAGIPAPVPVGCIEDLIARTSERRIVDDPGASAALSSRMPLGAAGTVVEGPLAGWSGICTLSTEKRVRLLLSLFGGQREVEFSQGAVKVA